MDCANANSGVGESGDAVIFTSRPNRSLTPVQARRIFWSLAGLCLGTAAAFSALGYWLILPFAGLEIGLLAWAFETIRERAGDYETLTLSGDTLTLEWQRSGGAGRREFNRQWARVECDCRAPGRDCHVCLCSHGRGSEVGVFLADEDRLALARTLKHRLAASAARAYPADNEGDGGAA